MQIRNLSSCLRDGVVSIDDETGKAREREKDQSM